MHFALGKTAYSNKSVDFQNLRNKMRGIITELDETTSDNNAFIMRVGQYLLVEFGEKGNAMYIYDTNMQPFDLTRGYVSIKKLKNKDKMESRYLHMDTLDGTWEDRFLTKLSSLTGRNLTLLGAARRPTARTIPPRPKATTTPVASNPQINQQSVIAFCLLYGLKYDDRTEKGGQLWVKASDKVAFIKRQLLYWEFRYSQKNRAWYRQF
jgi:hypothetical protein